MKNKLTKTIHGVSLVELMMGATVFIIIALGFFSAYKQFTIGAGDVNTKGRVNHRLREEMEIIRAQSIGDFRSNDFTTIGEADITTEHDRKQGFTVFRRIFPIDNQQIRKAYVKVQWEDHGKTRDKILKFEMIRIRGKEAGAKVKFCAVEDGTNKFLAGVNITLPGQDTAYIKYTTSDIDGCVVAYGAKLSNLPVDVYADARGAFHPAYLPDRGGYFIYNTGTHVYESVHTFHTPYATTDNGHRDDNDVTSIWLPPGKLSGQVTYLDNNNNKVGVAGAQLMMMLTDNPIAPPPVGEIFNQQVYAVTDLNGYYRFGGLMPGDYSPVYMLGNAEFMALDKENSSPMAEGYVPARTINPGQHISGIDFVTARRGALDVQVYEVVPGNSGNYQATSKEVPEINLIASLHPYTAYHTTTKYDFRLSGVWHDAPDHWTDLQKNPLPLLDSDSNGRILLPYFAPLIAHLPIPVSPDPKDQHNKILYLKTTPEVPGDMSPIVVLPASGGNPLQTKFLITRPQDDAPIVRPIQGDPTTLQNADPSDNVVPAKLSDFEFSILAKTAAQRPLYVLTRDAFVNIKGKVLWAENLTGDPDGQPDHNVGDYFLLKTGKIHIQSGNHWAENIGVLKEQDDGQVIINPRHDTVSRIALVGGINTHTFDLKIDGDGPNYFRLPPNVGLDQTLIKLNVAVEDQPAGWNTIIGHAEALEKIREGGQVKYRPVDITATDIPDVYFLLYWSAQGVTPVPPSQLTNPDDAWFYIWDNTANGGKGERVDFGDGRFETANNRAALQRLIYRAEIMEHLKPGQEYDGGTNDRFNFYMANAPSDRSYIRFYMGLSQSVPGWKPNLNQDSDRSTLIYQDGGPDIGHQTFRIKFFRQILLKSLYGSVRDSGTGRLIKNALMRFRFGGRPSITMELRTVDSPAYPVCPTDPCNPIIDPEPDTNYHLGNVIHDPVADSNLEIQVTASGYRRFSRRFPTFGTLEEPWPPVGQRRFDLLLDPREDAVNNPPPASDPPVGGDL